MCVALVCCNEGRGYTDDNAIPLHVAAFAHPRRNKRRHTAKVCLGMVSCKTSCHGVLAPPATRDGTTKSVQQTETASAVGNTVGTGVPGWETAVQFSLLRRWRRQSRRSSRDFAFVVADARAEEEGGVAGQVWW